MEKKDYTEKIGILSRMELKEALEDYALKEGITPSVVCRKAIYEYLLKKGVLSNDKRYF